MQNGLYGALLCCCTQLQCVGDCGGRNYKRARIQKNKRIWLVQSTEALRHAGTSSVPYCSNCKKTRHDTQT